MEGNRHKSTSIDTERGTRMVTAFGIPGGRGLRHAIMSTHSTRSVDGGQALVEYVLLFGLLTLVAAVVRPLLTAAISSAGIKFVLGSVLPD